MSFEEIDDEAIQMAAKFSSGSGGPKKVNADIWKHILCSKSYGTLSKDLADRIAVTTRKICIEDIPSEHTGLLFACRLIPLIKDTDGTRPIGIGEILRRIMGKAISKCLQLNIQYAGGRLQTCTGIEAGIEAAIHAIAKKFKDKGCEAIG